MTARDGSQPAAASGLTKVFISYSHDSDAHRANVLDLAQTLRRSGFDAVVDHFVEHDPPESWPVWMQDRVDEADFVLIFCTEVYARSFAQKAEPGTRRGSSWEARIITAEMYRREQGKGSRLIPIVARAEDARHIPPPLELGAYYVVGFPGNRDLSEVLRRLRGEPAVRPEEVRDYPVEPPHPPASSGGPAAVEDSLQQLVRLLDIAESGIPVRVATAAWQNLSPEDLERDVRVRVAAEWVYRTRQGGDDLVRPKKALAARVLSHLLDDVEANPPTARASDVVTTALVLAKFSWEREPKHSARLFRTLERHLKRQGDKTCILRAAKISVNASKYDNRTRFDAECEAHALISGVAWVYQRVGYLQEARQAAERSMILGNRLRWGRNSAFCLRCIGSLLRLEAEQSATPGTRLAESESHLLDAIDAFSRLTEFGPDDPEVGDCYCQLARTYLTWGRIRDAEVAAARAEELIPEGEQKDYLNLRILQGDLATVERDYTGALDHYDWVLDVDAADAEISEIAARARAQRGGLMGKMGALKDAEDDLLQAVSEFDELGEMDSASHVLWNLAELRGELPGTLRDALKVEPLPIRREAIEIFRERVASAGKAARRGAKKSGPREMSRAVAMQILKEAQARWAIKGSPW